MCLLFASCQPNHPSTEPTSTDAGEPDIRCYQPAPGKPRIREITYQGQVLLTPRQLRFRVLWSDDDGDLSGGHFQFFWNGKPLAKKPLPKDELSGKTRGGVTLILSLPQEETIQAQTQSTVELLLEDAEGHRSNRPLVTMESHR
ncbi:MAG TPA: hypothetical protein DCE42_01275 [Myxococcales bacterium]|nr:hypothetical protein [Deltaproteobacteria bacterium]HAA53353.1 hypothetical protein [Myxococcales bacterium]|tara:strand:+ start:11172 stop:11603 length:432 start_codon:yes stop_codon:yes gene_type:complete